MAIRKKDMDIKDGGLVIVQQLDKYFFRFGGEDSREEWQPGGDTYNETLKMALIWITYELVEQRNRGDHYAARCADLSNACEILIAEASAETIQRVLQIDPRIAAASPTNDQKMGVEK